MNWVWTSRFDSKVKGNFQFMMNFGTRLSMTSLILGFYACAAIVNGIKLTHTPLVCPRVTKCGYSKVAVKSPWIVLIRGGASDDTEEGEDILNVLGVENYDGGAEDVDGSLFDDDEDEDDDDESLEESVEEEEEDEEDEEEGEDEEEDEEDEEDGEEGTDSSKEEEGGEEEEEEEVTRGKVVAKATSEKAKKRRKVKKGRVAKSSRVAEAEKNVESPPPSTGGMMQQMMVTLGTMFVIKKMDLGSPTVIKNARLGFVCYHVLIQVLVLFVEFKCKAALKNKSYGGRTVTVESAWKKMVGAALSSQGGGAVGGAKDLIESR